MTADRYDKICNAILNNTNTEKQENSLMREWIVLFEKTRVVGWNRDEFFESMMKVKEKMK